MTFNKISAIFILIITICNCSIIQKEDEFARNQLIKKQFEQVDCDDKDRLSEVKKLFAEVGASPDEINVEKFDDVQNVVLTLKGKTDEIVVVGAHYDKTTLGCGVIDNWSGVVLVANLYKHFKMQKNNKTFRFAAFGKEEKGLVGSKAMVKAIPGNQKKNYCAMVNFDSFGFTSLWSLESTSDKKLIEIAANVAEKRKLEFAVINYMGASSDSKSFKKAGIPAITLSGLDTNWRDYLHQDKDRVENINFDKIYENFQFSINYLKEIDKQSCADLR
ncbi:MAG: M28 family metallopeptidase [Acidobacteriota bacterium]|nr:M28 family metallopeptidase [Acidobacteriota bacterium]